MSLNWEPDDRTDAGGAAADARVVERSRASLTEGYEARLTKVATEPGGGDRYHYRWAIVDSDGAESIGGSCATVSEAEERVIQEAQALFGGYPGPSGSGPEPT